MRRPLLAAALGAAMTASPALADTRYIAPYVELGQAVGADLTNDDVVTWTQVAVGVDAGVSNGRAEGQISARYERRIPWGGNLTDVDMLSGLARGSVKLSPALSIDAGALATRSRMDIRGAAPGLFSDDSANISNVYSLYVAPQLATNVGPAQVTAAYRFGYTRVDAPDFTGIAPGAQRLDYFDDETSHLAMASIGVGAGRIAPFGITLSGALERDFASQLSQRYEGEFARLDVVQPGSRTVAVRGGVGYEKIEATQRDALFDVNGNPVLDGNGRFVTDPASPRRIAYNTDGLIYDAGVIWRPSPRLELQANAGYRYGGATYFGSLSWRLSPDSAVRAVVYDGVTTFGRQLRDGLATLPTSFQTQGDGFGQQFTGCVFASQPATGGAGGCLNSAFQSVSTAVYRTRGVDVIYTRTEGRTRIGIGAGYANRRLFSPPAAPGITVFGTNDESYYAQIFYSRALSRVSEVDANLFMNYYDADLPGMRGVLGAGITGAYQYRFGRIGTIASLGLYTYDQRGFDSQWSAQGLLGARYTFR
mgnify:FL=1